MNHAISPRWIIVPMLVGVLALCRAEHVGASAPCASWDACVASCDSGDAAACERIRFVLAKACESTPGDAAACGLLGELYDSGHASTVVSKETSVTYLRRACELGHGPSCNNWGFALAYGQGVQRDDAAAIEVWKRGCEIDNAMSCGTYGARLRHGRGIARDDVKAGEILGKACRLGDASGCYTFGHWNEKKGRRKEALAAWTKSCAAKRDDACIRLRSLGQPLPPGAPTDAEAHASHVKDCDDNQPIGCSMAADDFRAGRGVPRDEKQALLLDARACDASYAPSCARLALFFIEHGEMERADRFYTDACDLGDSTSCGEAGFVRRTRGAGDDARAPLAMFELGCAANDAASCFGVGGELEAGQGVRPDRKKALAAYERACGWEHGQACVAAARLSPAPKAAQFRRKACSLGVKAACAPAKAKAARPRRP